MAKEKDLEQSAAESTSTELDEEVAVGIVRAMVDENKAGEMLYINVMIGVRYWGQVYQSPVVLSLPKQSRIIKPGLGPMPTGGLK